VTEPLAHATEEGRRHELRDHLTEVGRRAAEFAAAFTDPAWGDIAGRWHDLGKFAAVFQHMLAEANGFEAHLEGDASGPRDHSSAGAIHAFATSRDARGIALALAIAGHHGGLPAAADLLKRRLPLKQGQRCLERAVKGGAGARDLAATIPALPHPLAGPATAETNRHLELWVRMLFSCLCDADFLDTESFYDPLRARARREWADVRGLRARLDAHLTALAAAAPATEVNRVRAEVLAACRSAATLAPGAFSLTVPTGGGKTLASLAFALAHGEHRGLRRVVVAIPYTSIIEQTALVYRKALGDEAVLEHHSALDPLRETPRSRLAAENWDAPVVVTTTVQLFNSLFANRPAACRKLHRLARSVIVLDEAQSLPPALLTPILEALRLLSSDFGASIVISTATQPALGSDRIEGGLRDVREIVPREVRAFDRLRRVRTRWPSSPEPRPYEELAPEVAAERDVLAIVHRRDDARKLCELVDAIVGDCSTFHLSALMCPEHRSRTLAKIRERKLRGEHVRLVSTQLVEAGVDLDFAVVYRALGGLDALAQAAGRCNREGRLPGLGELRPFVAPTTPPPGVPATGLAVTEGMLAADRELDLFSPEPFGVYFERLYAAKNLDAEGIQPLRASLDFPAVASRFQMIEDGWSAPVVVPFGEAIARLDELERFGPNRERLRALQRYVVAVPIRERARWLAHGAAREVAGVVVALSAADVGYDDRFGLVLDRVGVIEASTLIG
jgi:CRISPR-associated endonuclease/helicase Cas3